MTTMLRSDVRRTRTIFTAVRNDHDTLFAAVAAFAAIAADIDIMTVVLDALPGESLVGVAQECAVTLLGACDAYRLGYGRRPDKLIAPAVARALSVSRSQFETVIALPPRVFPVAGIEPLLAVLASIDVEPVAGSRNGWWGFSKKEPRLLKHRNVVANEVADLETATSATGFVILPAVFDPVDLPAFVRDRYLSASTNRKRSRRYRFGFFSNGVPFDRIARELYLEALNRGLDFGDPGDASADPSFYQWLSSPEPAHSEVSRYLHRYRSDSIAALTDLHESWKPVSFDRSFSGIDPAAGENVVGLLRSEVGIGEAGRSMARALMRAGEPVAMLDISSVSSNRRDDRTFADFSDQAPFATSLLCVNPPEYDAFFNSAVADAFAPGRYRIGTWWWELTDLPASWLGAFGYIDELWVGSHFIEAAVRAVAPVPVTYVPPIVEVPIFDVVKRADFGLSSDETIVLFVFDFNSVWERKNADGAITAFRRAFHRAESVRLVVKTINAANHPEKAALLQKIINGDRQITWIDGYFDRLAVGRLMRACDVYLSLHRSEGFGLTIAEAMLLEKPVVVTNWSGNLDFTCPENSFPVDFSMVTLDEDFGPYLCGSRWAEPDLDHAAAQLRIVARDAEEAGRRASRARYDIRTRFSPVRVARIVRDRLNAIRTMSGTA